MSFFPEGASTMANMGAGMDIASSATNVFGGIVDLFTRKERREEHYEREDTAMQRRAADLEAAGLSKTLAAGTAAQATPVNRSSTQTRSNAASSVLAAAQTGLTNAKINESKTQADLNKMHTNVYRQQAMNLATENINKGIAGQGMLNANVLSKDKAQNIPRERSHFNELGWPYYKDYPGTIVGEVTRALASFARATTGLGEKFMTSMQPLIDKFTNIQFPSFDAANSWLKARLDDIDGLSKEVKEKVRLEFMDLGQQNNMFSHYNPNSTANSGYSRGPGGN